MDNNISETVNLVDPLAISYAGLQQVGPVINGPGAKRDTPYPTTNLTPAQQNDVVLAKKYAMDQSVRNVLVKQTLVHQNTVDKNLFNKLFELLSL